MNKKLFDKCLSVVKNRIRKLTMDKSNIQIALDNYKRDYEKTLRQLMKIHDLDEEITIDLFATSTLKRQSIKKGRLILVPTKELFAPYVVCFTSTKQNSSGIPMCQFSFDMVDEYASDLDRYFTEKILPYVVKESA